MVSFGNASAPLPKRWNFGYLRARFGPSTSSKYGNDYRTWKKRGISPHPHPATPDLDNTDTSLSRMNLSKFWIFLYKSLGCCPWSLAGPDKFFGFWPSEMAGCEWNWLTGLGNPTGPGDSQKRDRQIWANPHIPSSWAILPDKGHYIVREALLMADWDWPVRVGLQDASNRSIDQ